MSPVTLAPTMGRTTCIDRTWARPPPVLDG